MDCVTGFTLTSGDRTITCDRDAQYTSTNRLPVCTIGGSFIYNLIIVGISLKFIRAKILKIVPVVKHWV